MLDNDVSRIEGHYGLMPMRRRTHVRRSHLHLAEHREARRLSQDQVAEIMNAVLETDTIKGHDISRYENGKRGLSPERLSAFATAVGVSVAELYEPPSANARDQSIDELLDSAGADEAVRRRIRQAVKALLGQEDPEIAPSAQLMLPKPRKVK